MSPLYRFDHSQGLVIVTWPSVSPNAHLVRSTVEAILADPSRPEVFGLLSDWRSARDAPDTRFVNDFLELLKAWDGKGLRKWATVIRVDSVASYGMGRMVETRADANGNAYRVFRDYDSALAWLTTEI